MLLTFIYISPELVYDMSVSLDDVKSYFDSKFSSLAAKSASASNLKVKTLKSPGNQHQFDHTNKVLLAVRTAEANIREEAYDEAIEELREAAALLEKRIKLIRLADRSEHGWQTVHEYLSDDLASDSEDEKKIRKAESEAAKKRKLKQEAFKKRTSSSFRRDRQPQGSNLAQGGFSGSSPFNKSFKLEDRCYQCGKQGHWRAFCPSIRTGSGSQFKTVPAIKP